MPIEQFDQRRIRKICNHEAGHYIVAREMSFETNGIAAMFQPRIGHSGETHIQLWKHSIASLAELTAYLEKRLKILHAGAIAEAMDVQGKYDIEYARKACKEGSSAMDNAKIRELTHILRDTRYPDTSDEELAQQQLAEIGDELTQQAGAIIYDRIGLIHGVGDMLFRKVEEYNIKYELTEAEIDSIPIIRQLYLDKNK